MVAVRSTGYSFDSIIAYQDIKGDIHALVDEAYLRVLTSIANERFKINAERIGRFQTALAQEYQQVLGKEKSPSTVPDSADSVWEEPNIRRERKKAEGLARRQVLQAQASNELSSTKTDDDEDASLSGMFS